MIPVAGLAERRRYISCIARVQRACERERVCAGSTSNNKIRNGAGSICGIWIVRAPSRNIPIELSRRTSWIIVSNLSYGIKYRAPKNDQRTYGNSK